MPDKKELKKKYKEMIPEMGVFQVRNTESGKIWIARSPDIRAGINSCRYQLKHGLFHQNALLQQDYQRLGEERFTFEVLDRLEMKKDPGYNPVSDLAELEQLWIEKLQPFGEKGYHKQRSPR